VNLAFLDEIVQAVRHSVSRSDYDRGVPARARGDPPSFRQAVEHGAPGGALVVEYKRVSPGQSNPMLPTRSVAEFLSATGQHATAYSCLATAPLFDGSPSDVAELAGATELPVLYKDFVVDERQVEVAARTGASAVLLIARLEENGRPVPRLSGLADAAHRLGLEVVLEFHHRSELRGAADVAADVYGVNTRNLDTLTIDRATALATLGEAQARGLRPLLGMSGVESRADADRLWEAGVDGLLVGTSVARAVDPASFLAGLKRPAVGGSP